MTKLILISVALFGLTVVATPARAQVADAQIVRCQAGFSSGSTTQVMSCSAWGLGTWTSVPSGKHFAITDVTVVPYSSSSTAISGFSFQKTLNGSLFDLFYLRVTGSNSVSHSYRSPPLVLNGGTQLTMNTWWDTNTQGQVTVTGILSSEFNAAVR